MADPKKYKIQAPDGRTISLEGDTPPTEQDIDAAFAAMPPAPKQGGKAISGTPLDLANAMPLIQKGIENAPNSEALLNSQKASEGMRAIAADQVLKGKHPAQIGETEEGIQEVLNLFDRNKKGKELGDVARDRGVPENIASIIGLAADVVTDPIQVEGAKQLKKGLDAIPADKAKHIVADSPSSVNFNLNPAKTVADYDSEIKKVQDELLQVGKGGEENPAELVSGSKPIKDVKVQAKDKVTALAERLEQLESEKVINEMSDFKNNRIRRTPDAMSLMTTYMEKRGQFGAAIARQVERASNTLDGLRAKWLSRFESTGDLNKVFSRLTPEEKTHLIAAKEGFEQVNSPKIEKIIKLMEMNEDEIADEAAKRGLMVQDSAGITKPFQKRTDYVPHFLLSPDGVMKNPSMLTDTINYHVKNGTFGSYDEGFQVWESYREALRGNFGSVLPKPNSKTKAFYEWLVKNGQAADEDGAYDLFKRHRERVQSPKFNNLEFARDLNIPFYDVDPIRVLTRHYSGAAKRFGEIDAFGRTGDIANKLVQGIASELGEKEAQNITRKLNLITGVERPSDLLEGASKVIRNLEAASKLGLAVVINATQSINTASVTGMLNTSRAFIEAFSKEGKDFAFKSGSILNEFTQAMYGVTEDSITGKMATEVLSKTGFSAMERNNRVIAAIAGKHFAEDMARKLIAGEGKTEAAVRAAKALRRMDIRPERVMANKGLMEEDLLQAARSTSTRTQFRARIQDSPEWAVHPVGKIVNQFKNFAENQWKFLREELVNEAKSGNFAPILRYAVLAPIAGDAQKRIKAIITGKEKLDIGDSWFQQYLDNAASVGAIGLLYDVIKSVQYQGGSWLGAMSPGVEDVGRLTSNGFQAVKPLIDRFMGEDEAMILNLKPLTRQVAEAMPVIGPRLVEGLKSEQEKKRAATQKVREAIENNADIKPILAILERKGIDTGKALKNAEKVLKKKGNETFDEKLQIEKARSKGDYLTAALLQLGFGDNVKK